MSIDGKIRQRAGDVAVWIIFTGIALAVFYGLYW
jgi:hypothetical protein